MLSDYLAPLCPQAKKSLSDFLVLCLTHQWRLPVFAGLASHIARYNGLIDDRRPRGRSGLGLGQCRASFYPYRVVYSWRKADCLHHSPHPTQGPCPLERWEAHACCGLGEHDVKAFLREMVVVAEDVCQALAPHRLHGDTVGQAVFLSRVGIHRTSRRPEGTCGTAGARSTAGRARHGAPYARPAT